MPATWTPTTQQLLDLDGVHVRADRFDFELADREWNVIGDLFYDPERPPTITNDTSRSVPRSVSSLYMPALQVADINPVTDRVIASMTLSNGERFELGGFLWAQEQRPRRPWGVERASNLVDQCHILEQPMSTAIGQNKGANIIVIAVALASALIPIDQIVFTSSTQGLDAPIGWPPGKSRIEALNELMRKLGYLPVHFDRNRRLIMRDAPTVDASTTPDHVYELWNPTDGGHLLTNDQTETDDLLEARNRWVAYESSGQNAYVFGRYDLPNEAPNSIVNRGFPVTKVESVQGLQNAAQARKAAQTMALTDDATFLWWEFGSTADPRHDTWGVVQYLGQLGLEPFWSLVCTSGGVMRHRARRVY
jgi:hypothetical protein